MYWFKCCRSFICSISCLVKKYMNYDGACKFFYKKKLFEKQLAHRRSYANKIFIFRYLLNFTTKCIGGQIKAFSLLSCSVFTQKVQKVEKSNMWKEYKLMKCVYTQWKSTKRWRALIHRIIRKQWIKNNRKKENRFLIESA